MERTKSIDEEYKRRLELREARKREVEKAAGWSDDPGVGNFHARHRSAANSIAKGRLNGTKPPKDGFHVEKGSG